VQCRWKWIYYVFNIYFINLMDGQFFHTISRGFRYRTKNESYSNIIGPKVKKKVLHLISTRKCKLKRKDQNRMSCSILSMLKTHEVIARYLPNFDFLFDGFFVQFTYCSEIVQIAMRFNLFF